MAQSTQYEESEGRSRPTERTGKDELKHTRARQREEYGGFNFGAAFFGWLVATGLAVMLIAILGAAGAAIGLTELSGSEANDSAETISIVGGALLIAVLAVAYYAGGCHASTARAKGSAPGSWGWW